MMGRFRRAVLCLLAVLALAGCTFPSPPEPTLNPTPRPSPTRTATRRGALTPTRSASLPPPVTPTPALPPATPPPSDTPPPPTATGDPAGLLAALAVTPQGDRFDLVVSEAQVNAALAQAFDARPLPGHAITPRATLGFGFLTLSMYVYPPDAPAGGPPQRATLMLRLEHPGGFLETFPTQLEPLDAGIPTRLVKSGEALFLDALNGIVLDIAGERPLFCEQSAIRPQGIHLTLIR
ncbi:MAG: hypothetical protein IT323_10100 [Anaerolineae bacterium]|nr:hypothetical protein [Anaerolineae bacterium]